LACVSVASLEEVKIPDDTEVIIVDEGQFFKDILQLDAWANRFVVIVAALDTTYERNPFGSIHELLARAERVTKLTAVCISCGRDAAYTQRIGDSAGKAVVCVGSAELYKPVCRQCHAST